MPEFHSMDGLYFERLEDGAVKVKKKTTAQAFAPVVFEMVVSSALWASIVKHVGPGENPGPKPKKAKSK